jgi:FlaA1/EpsC-like NDP-sugar epimerase
MTISEAVSLAVQASTKSQGSEIFVLDMGEPIRIVDLAENMIRLAGRVPYEDIDIQFTGLRPGEKLTEEINGKSEDLLAPYMKNIQIIREHPLDWDVITGWIDELEELLAARHEPGIIAHIQKLVPEYNPAPKWASSQVVEMLVDDGSAAGHRNQNGNGSFKGLALRNSSTPPIACEQ